MARTGAVVTVAGLGALLVWSGISNAGVLASIRDIIQGNPPVPGSDQFTSAASTSGATGQSVEDSSVTAPVSGGSGEAALQSAAAAYGWDSGSEWNALVAIENQEAGFNPTAKNASSGAYGMAQSLGHGYAGGPASNGVNEYGGEGLTPAQSEQASLGDPVPQAIWMVNYIKSRYGTPEIAEAFHLANNWY